MSGQSADEMTKTEFPPSMISRPVYGVLEPRAGAFHLIVADGVSIESGMRTPTSGKPAIESRAIAGSGGFVGVGAAVGVGLGEDEPAPTVSSTPMLTAATTPPTHKWWPWLATTSRSLTTWAQTQR